MTRPEAARRTARFGAWLVARGWVHVLLLTGAALFLYPLLWMACISLKTDEEMADSRLLPSLPSFRASSPAVRTSVLTRPDAVSARAWPDLRTRLLQCAEGAVARRLARSPAVPVDQQAWRRAAAALAVGQVLQRIPSTSFAHDDTALAAVAAQLSDEVIDQALDGSLARCELQGLQLYTDDAQLYPLYSGTTLQGALRLESGHAQLVPVATGVRIDYVFGSGADAPVVLAIPFMLPSGVQAAALHKLVLSLRNDDSWHRISASLECGGRQWLSTRITPLAQNRQTTITFQPPGFDDATFKARLWVPLRDAGPSPAGPPGACCLRIQIHPSSTVQAIWQKCRHNYDLAFHAVPFWTYLGNSVILVALTVGGSLFSSAFVAYAFARLRWPGRAISLTVMLATMMLPSQVTMIPSFLIWRELGWYNTLNPLWIGAWTGNAFFIFLMVQHLRTIPRELEEAARIDGLNTLQTWWYIIVPQLKPTLAAIAIMSFMNAWNDFMGPLIYLRDQSRFPLSLGLFGMKVEDTGANFGLMMAGDLLLTLPAILVFFCFQRYFIQGMTVSGMKG